MALMTASIAYYNELKWFVYVTSINYVIVCLMFIFAFIASLVYTRSTTLNNFNKERRNTYVEAIVLDNPAVAVVVASVSSSGKERTSSIEPISRLKDEPCTESISCFLKIYWALYTISLVSCTEVVILYWVLLHDYKTSTKLNFINYMTIDRHGSNLLLLLIELSINKIPIRVLHLIYAFIYGLIYIIFYAIYWGSTKEVIYPVLNFSKAPGQAVGYIFLVIFVLTPICYMVFYFVFWIKNRISGG